MHAGIIRAIYDDLSTSGTDPDAAPITTANPAARMTERTDRSRPIAATRNSQHPKTTGTPSTAPLFALFAAPDLHRRHPRHCRQNRREGVYDTTKGIYGRSSEKDFCVVTDELLARTSSVPS